MHPKIGIFPGSFDPFTLGHYDIVKRSLQLFDEVIIAIGANTSKNRYFSSELMLEKIRALYADEKRVQVKIYTGLTSEFAKVHHAHFLIRGLRNATDLEYEKSIAFANHYLNHQLETVFLMTDAGYSNISSSIIREMHKHGAQVRTLLPYPLD